jgi:hypothetical protein
MTVKPSRPGGRCPGGQQLSGGKPTTTLPVGRPKGAPSTMVNVRLPLTLVAELDRYLDRLEGPDRPQGQPWHDHAAGLRAFLGVARFHGRDRERGVGGGIVAENRHCRV